MDRVIEAKLECLDNEIVREVEHMICDYKQEWQQKKKKGIDLDIIRHITPKDDTPVSTPPRHIPYSQREEIIAEQ